MAMEVLLRRTIDGVGAVGEVVRVKNGYARNFLLPQGYAAVVSPESLRQTERDKKEEAVRQAKFAEECKTLAAQIEGVTLTIEARAGEDGHLYGSVGMRHVIAALLELGYRFVERQIRFETVRELGEYEAELVLSAQITVPVKVWVVQDALEAQEMAEAAATRATTEASGVAPRAEQ
jgi:large subunit ribosomal protein L9